MTDTNGNGREKLVDTIKKLRAKAAGTTNEHEAAAFAAKVQALLLEHNIAESEVETDNNGADESLVMEAAGLTTSYPWRRPLAVAVAQMYLCKYFYSTIRDPKGSKDKHTFVGGKANVTVAKEMFEYLHETIDALAKAGARSVPEKERSPYRTTFRAAATRLLNDRIYAKIREAKEGTGQTKMSDGRNLPALLDLYESWDKRNAKFIADQIGKLRTAKSRMSNLHAQGYDDGQKAGRNVGLDPQVAAQGASKRLR